MSLFLAGCGDDEKNTDKYALHKDIMASTFWAGEAASDANGQISNVPSAWDPQWGNHYMVNGQQKGDAPDIDRDADLFPTGYTGSENVYYFALPYNDASNIVYDGDNKNYDNVINLDKNNYRKGNYGIVTSAFSGGRKSNAKNIPWYDTESSWSGKSIVKGRWVKVRSIDHRTTNPDGQKGNGEWVYAQWLDAGPYHYDDFNYVFGNARPRNEGQSIGVSPFAGIDLSPAVMQKMGFSKKEMGAVGINRKVDWQFVDYEDVPDGPWKKVISDNKTGW